MSTLTMKQAMDYVAIQHFDNSSLLEALASGDDGFMLSRRARDDVTIIPIQSHSPRCAYCGGQRGFSRSCEGCGAS